MLEIGSKIDKYTVVHKIGTGGMSNVYLVINEQANKQWAVKEIKKVGGAKGEMIRQNMIAEAEILKNLHHPHLVSIVDIIENEDTFLMFMDYIEGGTLKKKLDEEGPQSQEDVVNWAIQMCDVFHYLHNQKKPIIYRDTKPSNIMLKPDGNIVLIDFGTAREHKEGSDEDTMWLGTRGYAAPEQFGGQGQTDPRTDIYNLGATMYHLVTGHSPSKPPYEIRPIRDWDKSLSSGLEAIIMKCTKADPEERYQSADELKYDLENYRQLDRSEQRLSRKHLRVFAGMCAASVVSLAAGFVFSHMENDTRNNTYAALMQQADASTDDEGRENLYKEAIRLDPSGLEAYDRLLNTVYLSDGNFTKTEADSLTEITGYKGAQDTKSALDKLAENTEAYDEFCYDCGLAYFYYYEDAGNKQMSKPWFETARKSETLDEGRKMRAERLYKIAEYSIQLNNRNKAGDNTFSYKDYWNDMLLLTSGNIARQDNIRTALVMYKEMSYQIAAHGLDFYNAGVTTDEMREQLTSITKHIEDDIHADAAYNEAEYGMIEEEINGNILAARTSLDTIDSAPQRAAAQSAAAGNEAAQAESQPAETQPAEGQTAENNAEITTGTGTETIADSVTGTQSGTELEIKAETEPAGTEQINAGSGQTEEGGADNAG